LDNNNKEWNNKLREIRENAESTTVHSHSNREEERE
jgi:hypothetical protein